jgi:hypothetical protein
MLKTTLEPSTPASVRVRAAECVLSHATKAIEIEDIEARVSELERAAQLPAGAASRAAPGKPGAQSDQDSPRTPAAAPGRE